MITADRYLAHRSRWALIVRGILSIILGLIAIFFPGIALLAFIYVFAAYALIDGIMAVIWAIQERVVAPYWIALLLEGLVSIVIGILAFFWPTETAIVLLFLVAAWAIITGILEIVTAFIAFGGIGHEWLLALAGAVSILFGIALFTHPLAGLLALLWLLGIYAIIFGILFIVRALQPRLRRPFMG
jgi:uncharacterized membrane protein HdeD (DUF308 family)